MKDETKMETANELVREQPHSVEFSINAKGQWSGKCKSYGQSPEESYLRALEIANKIEQLIKTKNE